MGGDIKYEIYEVKKNKTALFRNSTRAEFSLLPSLSSPLHFSCTWCAIHLDDFFVHIVPCQHRISVCARLPSFIKSLLKIYFVPGIVTGGKEENRHCFCLHGVYL